MHKNKTAEAFINDLEKIIYNIIELKDKLPKSITHMRTTFCSEFQSDTFKSIVGNIPFVLPKLSQNMKNKMV